MALTPETPQLPDAALVEALQAIIAEEALTIVFQPIVDLKDGTVIGYEALTRLVDNSVFAHSGALFDAADRLNLLAELEGVARRAAFRAAAGWSGEQLLFINNSPPIVADTGFVECVCAEMGALDPRRVVLEITERTDFEDLQSLRLSTLLLREQGFRIALDDVGAGISGLNRIMALRPNWVKLDMELVSQLDSNPMQQNLIRTLQHFARLSSMQLVAEGLERYEELAALVELGVHFGQGYYLARPGDSPGDIGEDVRATIVNLRQNAEARRFEDPSAVRVASLAYEVPVFDKSTTCRVVHEELSDPRQPDTAVILDGRRFLGIVHLNDLQAFIAERRAGAEIGMMRLRRASMVGQDITLAEAIELVASRDYEEITEPLVVQQDGRVIGVVTLRQLLRSAMSSVRRSPSHVARLTGLPSRVQADQWIANRIAAGDPRDVVFLDLREFDAYNVAYGFEQGDAVLLKLVGLINVHFGDLAGDVEIFHIGEDRFLVSARGNLEPPTNAVMTSFEDARSEFFSTIDLAADAFRCPTPNDSDRTYALTTVRAVLIEQPFMRISEARELYALARSIRLADHSDAARGTVLFDRRSSRSARKSA